MDLPSKDEGGPPSAAVVDLAHVEDQPDMKNSSADLATRDSASVIASSVNDNPFYYDLSGYYRWFMITALGIMSIFIGPAFMNWDPLDTMFHWSNAYAHLCHPSDPTYELRAQGEIYCEAKKLAIEGMYGPAVSTMFIMDLPAGIILDCFGGKVVTTIGLTLVILGWVIIGVSGPAFNGYFAGIILCAMGTDPAFFGLLSVANLFPGWSSTILSILGAGRSVAWANGMIMRAIWGHREGISLRGISLVFAGILLCWLVFTIVFIPIQTYPKLPVGCKLNTEIQEGKISTKQHLKKKPRIDMKLFMTEAKIQFKGFLEHALNLPYLALCFVPISVFIRNNYYGMTYKEHLPSVIDFYTIMNPLSLLPCPLLGIFADKVSAALTILLLSACGALSMFLVMFDVLAFEYLSVILNFAFVSFISSQFYVYVGYVYPQQQMGKLVGVVVLVGGIAALAANPMADFAKSNNNFFPMDLTVVLLSICVILIAIYLYFKLERPIRRAAKAVAAEKKGAVDNAMAEGHDQIGTKEV